MNNKATKIAPTLNARLASACDCAYGINKTNGNYNPPKIYHDGVGWTASPTAISAPAKSLSKGPRINACLVGTNQDGIIVSFRGTLPPAWTVASMEDWWQDIVDSKPVAKNPLPGKVHEGFWDALETIWAQIVIQIKTLTNKNPGMPIYITGHSKGGPLASIGAARLLLEKDISIAATQVVTFASPHPGDVDFVQNYPSCLPVIRFENYLDIVPLLVPTNGFFKIMHEILPAFLLKKFCKYFPKICASLGNAAVWNYAPLGTLQYVTSNGKVVNESSVEAAVDIRVGQILWVMLGLTASADDLELLEKQTTAAKPDTGITRIGAAHCIACKSDDPKKYCAGGYITGAGGDSICPV